MKFFRVPGFILVLIFSACAEGNWWNSAVTDTTGEENKDSDTPYIGENGNWWVGTADLGKKASHDTDTYLIIFKTGIGAFENGTNTFLLETVKDIITPPVLNSGSSTLTAWYTYGMSQFNFFQAVTASQTLYAHFVITGIEDAASYLKTMPGGNKTNPVNLTLTLNLGDMKTGSAWHQLLNVFSECEKYVNIDLYSSAMASTVFQGSSGIVQGKEKIISVELPSRITSVGEYAFANCTNLSQIYLPDKISSIGSEAFSNCESISIIELPNELRSIGSRAFERCSNLSLVISSAKTPPVLGTNAFNTNSNFIIKVPANSAELYMSANGWSKFKKNIKLIEEDGNIVIFNKNNADNDSGAAFPSMMLIPSNLILDALPSLPMRNNYKFKGWNTASDGSGEAIDENTSVTESFIAYAQWEFTGGAIEVTNEIISHNAPLLEEGRNFSGIIDKDGIVNLEAGAFQYKFPEGDFNIYDYDYFVVNYTLLSKSGTTSGISVRKYDSGAMYSNVQNSWPWLSNQSELQFQIPERKDKGIAFQFNGMTGIPIILKVNSITFRKYPAFTVTFRFNNDDRSTPVHAKEIREGSKLGEITPAPPQKAGWRFAGWFDEYNNRVTAVTPVHKNMTLTAQWTDTESPKVEYITNAPGRASGVPVYRFTPAAGDTWSDFTHITFKIRVTDPASYAIKRQVRMHVLTPSPHQNNWNHGWFNMNFLDWGNIVLLTNYRNWADMAYILNHNGTTNENRLGKWVEFILPIQLDNRIPYAGYIQSPNYPDADSTGPWFLGVGLGSHNPGFSYYIKDAALVKNGRNILPNGSTEGFTLLPNDPLDEKFAFGTKTVPDIPLLNLSSATFDVVTRELVYEWEGK